MHRSSEDRVLPKLAGSGRLGSVATMRACTYRVPPRSELEAGFAAVRAELGVPEHFAPETLAAARRAIVDSPPRIERAGGDVADRRDIELVTIDPPSSVDLDQAVHIARTENGYRVSYAISDPAAFVEPGGSIDLEAHRRGVTYYTPDRRTPLYPPVIGENAASLLPNVTRPAFLWSLDLDAKGELVGTNIERATVMSREKLSYAEAQRRIDQGSANESLALLRVVGDLRASIEHRRGGVSLNLPSQEVELVDGNYQLGFDETLDVENWNAQISLLTGMAAAQVMLDGGVGLLRRLPVPDERVLDTIRRAAIVLGVDWPEEMTYADKIRDVHPDRAEHVALLAQAVRALRGADYAAFHGQPPHDTIHWAIGADYSHVTAPIRRLGDRYANEIALALCSETDIPRWVMDSLDSIPETLGDARRLESSLDRAIVDYVEAVVLEPRVGETFQAWVTSQRGDNRSLIQISEPAVAAVVDATLEPGDEIAVRLTAVDSTKRKVDFEPI